MRAKKLAADSGRTFLTSYAAPGALLAPVPVTSDTGGNQPDLPPIVDAFFSRARDNKEVSSLCSSDFAKYAASTAKVQSSPGAGETDPGVFSCDKVDDLGVALTGLHPADVWVMRFDANLPRNALTADLTIEPLASDQTPVQSHLVASKSVNDACSSGAMASIVPARPPLRGTGFTALVLGLGVAVARRLARTRKAPST